MQKTTIIISILIISFSNSYSQNDATLWETFEWIKAHTTLVGADTYNYKDHTFKHEGCNLDINVRYIYPETRRKGHPNTHGSRYMFNFSDITSYEIQGNVLILKTQAPTIKLSINYPFKNKGKGKTFYYNINEIRFTFDVERERFESAIIHARKLCNCKNEKF